MPFLLYCICEAQAEVAAPAAGVGGAPVQKVGLNGLQCFYSEIGGIAAEAATLQQEAIQFHGVVHAIFQTAATIPFRFPTLMQQVNEITALLAPQASEYEGALHRLRHAVQMEIRIGLAGEAPGEAASGSDYLRTRAEISRKLDQATAAFRTASEAYALEWRQRLSRNGAHCFVLVRRAEIYNLEQAFRTLPLDPALKAIVSGPWPATEFLSSVPGAKPSAERKGAAPEE